MINARTTTQTICQPGGEDAASRRELFELLHASGEDGEKAAVEEEIEEAMAEFHATPMPLRALISNMLLLVGM